MIISVINHSGGLLSDEAVQRAIRAINRQLAEDFAPVWDMSATLKLEGPRALPRSPDPAKQNNLDVRGDAVIYLWHPVDIPAALGFHAANYLGIPYGFVFPQIAQALGEPWTATLSHEALEMTADPEVNLLVMGPHPHNPSATVFHWYEVCDAVQDDRYLIDEVPVSNFVLPLFFTNSEETGSRNDFLGRRHSGRQLRSFGVNPGGYVGYYNPATAQHEMFLAEGDTVALKRMRMKQQLGLTRRAKRYEAVTAQQQPITASLRQFLNRTGEGS